MRSFLFFIAACMILVACKSKEASPETNTVEETVVKDSTLITDSSWGLITKNMGYTELVNAFGSANLKDQRICGPECIDSLDVTFVYPDTEKEIIIYWKDSAWHKTIASLESYKDNSPYHTAEGLKRGSTMEELLKQNGKKISFSGFGWDYGGYIQSYNGGRFENSKVNFRLDIAEEGGTELLGDSYFDTEMPAVKKALTKIRVWQLLLSFDKN